jgi:hypothetical protein
MIGYGIIFLARGLKESKVFEPFSKHETGCQYIFSAHVHPT